MAYETQNIVYPIIDDQFESSYHTQVMETTVEKKVFRKEEKIGEDRRAEWNKKDRDEWIRGRQKTMQGRRKR
jgi:hypothetical protein